MSKKMLKKKTPAPTSLKGRTAIAKFMGTTPASAQTWAKQGMPVKRICPLWISTTAKLTHVVAGRIH
jgi:hypothetical protein